MWRDHYREYRIAIGSVELIRGAARAVALRQSPWWQATEPLPY